VCVCVCVCVSACMLKKKIYYSSVSWALGPVTNFYVRNACATLMVGSSTE
jgi:hypothetical protein